MFTMSLPPCAEQSAQLWALDTAVRKHAGGMANLWEPRLVNTLLQLATNTVTTDDKGGPLFDLDTHSTVVATGPGQYEWNSNQAFVLPQAASRTDRIYAFPNRCKLCSARSSDFSDVYPVASATAAPRRPLVHCWTCHVESCSSCCTLTTPRCQECQLAFCSYPVCRTCKQARWPSRLCVWCETRAEQVEATKAVVRRESLRSNKRTRTQ